MRRSFITTLFAFLCSCVLAPHAFGGAIDTTNRCTDRNYQAPNTPPAYCAFLGGVFNLMENHLELAVANPGIEAKIPNHDIFYGLLDDVDPTYCDKTYYTIYVIPESTNRRYWTALCTTYEANLVPTHLTVNQDGTVYVRGTNLQQKAKTALDDAIASIEGAQEKVLNALGEFGLYLERIDTVISGWTVEEIPTEPAAQ